MPPGESQPVEVVTHTPGMDSRIIRLFSLGVNCSLLTDKEKCMPPLFIKLTRSNFFSGPCAIPQLTAEEIFQRRFKKNSSILLGLKLIAHTCKNFFSILLTMAIILLSIATAQAAQVTLAWDANTPAPEGYRIFLRSDGSTYNYASPAWSGSATSCTINGLTNGVQYYFVVRAFIGTDETGDSNEVAYLPAVVQPVTFTITASAGTNGMISPSGNTTVASGNNQTFVITANSSYHISNVVVDGVSVGAVGSYTFSNVSANHTIAATFDVDSQPSVNDPPVADAGVNQTVTSGTRVTLNGSGSSDPEGGALTYQWSQTSGIAVTLSASNVANPRFTAPQVASGQSVLLVFELTVTDNQSATCADTCVVQVNSATPVDSGGTGVPGGQNTPPSTPQYQPPDQPAILYPADGDTSVPTTLTLKSSDFSDPDAGDIHTKSEWLIRAASDQNIVLQTTREGRSLTSLRVPRLVLDGATTYICQVRYYDSHGLISNWSNGVSFTTRCAKNSFCTSALSSSLTLAITTDFNANNIPDSEEPQVIRTTQSLDGETFIGIEAEEGASTIESVATIDPSEEDPESMPTDIDTYDLFTYRITVDEPGAEALVKVHFNKSVPAQAKWLCYDTSGEWITCEDNIYPQADEAGITRLIQDGGPDDVDGTANGIIVDTLGIDKTALGEPNDNGLDNSHPSDTPAAASGSSCFIGSMLE